MILPDELEAELQLRERIAIKTLAIDFTLGLEQGTGAEADWMASYKYQRHHQPQLLPEGPRHRADRRPPRAPVAPLRRARAHTQWADNLSGWFRAEGADDGSPLVARALIGYQGGELERFTATSSRRSSTGFPIGFGRGKPGRVAVRRVARALDGQTWPPPHHAGISRGTASRAFRERRASARRRGAARQRQPRRGLVAVQ